MVLIAVSVIALVACEKHQVDRTSDNCSFEFTSEKPAFDDVVKTEWNGATVLWSSTDKIRVAFTVDDVWQKADGDVTTNSEAQLYASTQAKSDDGFVTANFSVPNNFAENEGVHEFYALYPSDKVNSNTAKFTAPDVKIEVASVQNLSSVTFDSSADVMLGTSGEIPERPDAAIPIRWNRLVAHAYITLADLKDWSEGEVVTSVTLTADPDASMTGDFDLDITTGVSSLKTGNSTANVLTVNNGSLTVVDGDVSFWACMMPCTWKSVQVVVDTDKATYTREIDLSAKQKTFLQNRRNLLTINMSTADRQAKVGKETTYTFTEKDWSDGTSSWTKIVEGASFANGGVCVRSTSVVDDVWPSAICDDTFTNVKSVKVTYCTNKTAGEGVIKVTINGVTKECVAAYVSGDGREASWVAELDFSQSPVTGTPKLEVMCSVNSLYIKSITIIE